MCQSAQLLCMQCRAPVSVGQLAVGLLFVAFVLIDLRSGCPTLVSRVGYCVESWPE